MEELERASNSSKTVVSRWYGAKVIDPIVGEVEMPETGKIYNHKREEYAKKCAEELGISPVSEELKEFAVKYSDIPSCGLKDMYSDPNIIPSVSERDLCGMKCVYKHGSTANFIDCDGHTYLVPANKVILDELEKSGYVVIPQQDMEMSDTITIGHGNEYEFERVRKEDIRPQLTISTDLFYEMQQAHEAMTVQGAVGQTIHKDYEGTIPHWVGLQKIEGTELMSPTFSYDVFDRRIESPMPGLDYIDIDYAYDLLGHNNKNAQKLKAMTGLSNSSALIVNSEGNKEAISIVDLQTLRMAAAFNPYLNGEAQLIEESKKQNDGMTM